MSENYCYDGQLSEIIWELNQLNQKMQILIDIMSQKEKEESNEVS